MNTVTRYIHSYNYKFASMIYHFQGKWQSIVTAFRSSWVGFWIHCSSSVESLAYSHKSLWWSRISVAKGWPSRIRPLAAGGERKQQRTRTFNSRLGHEVVHSTHTHIHTHTHAHTHTTAVHSVYFHCDIAEWLKGYLLYIVTCQC